MRALAQPRKPRLDRLLVARSKLFPTGDAEIEIVQMPVAQTVYPAVNPELLAARPCVLDDRRLTDVHDLLDDVELAEPVASLRLVADSVKPRPVSVIHVLYVPKPVVDEPEPVVAHRRHYAAVPVMAADDDVLDPENIDRKLHHGKTVEIGMRHDVGHVAVHEQCARQEIHDLVGGHSTVGTADPGVVGRLLSRELSKVFPVSNHETSCGVRIMA